MYREMDDGLCPVTAPSCGPVSAYFYAFGLADSKGFFDANSIPETADRSMWIGSGAPSNPRTSVSSDPTDDTVYVTTSEVELILIPDTQPLPDSRVQRTPPLLQNAA